MLDQLLEWDIALFLFLNGLGTSFFDPFWMLMTHKATNFAVYLVLLFWFYRFKGMKQTLFLLLSVGALILVTDQITNVFKNGFERLRPCHNLEVQDVMRLVKSGCGGLYSYFSGHASNSFALATYFSILFSARFPKLKFVLFLIAACIAYSRVYVGVHFPLDIVSGAVFGTLWALCFYWISTRIFQRIFLNATLKL
ncbi:MAG: phosphatase PAP2 family protein [Candidatus Arcticimaribacter sp.]|nr:MAG: phosphatase PAP2 family protein [Candidatus Arcticimaribacter sp.]PTL98505.1 MAG: phosphatase PAP2 family protein [Candidatus Arcticimaribacter sp.]